jgi:hypothetical protein
VFSSRNAELSSSAAHPEARRTSAPLASTVLPRVLETQTPPRRAAHKRLITREDLVAGVGFEPTTFRL